MKPKKILEKLRIPAEIPKELKEKVQRLDMEIHRLAHRIEEIRMGGRMHPADREVEIDRLKGEFYSKMRDFVWTIRNIDRKTGLFDLPSNR